MHTPVHTVLLLVVCACACGLRPERSDAAAVAAVASDSRTRAATDLTQLEEQLKRAMASRNLKAIKAANTLLHNTLAADDTWDTDETIAAIPKAWDKILGPQVSLEDDTRWPTLMVIGEQKAGTSYLSSWLAKRPGVCLGKHGNRPGGNKEMHFWNEIGADPVQTPKVAKKVSTYLESFHPSGKGESCMYSMDNTPKYSRVQRSALMMKTWYPQRLRSKMRFIFIVREPTERLLSVYNHWRDSKVRCFNPAKGGSTNLTFPQFTENVFTSARILASKRKYECFGADGILNTPATIAEFQSQFGANQLLTISFDALFRNPPKILSAIISFLDLPASSIPLPTANATEHVNTHNSASKVAAGSAPDHCASAKRIVAAFKSNVEKLYQLTTKEGIPPMQPVLPLNFGFAPPTDKFCTDFAPETMH
jgi:hypothetical protein